MEKVWIYEAYEVEDYCVKTTIVPFKTEEAARKFWNQKKKDILDTTDDSWKVEDNGDSLYIYDEESQSENSWNYSIKEYAFAE